MCSESWTVKQILESASRGDVHCACANSKSFQAVLERQIRLGRVKALKLVGKPPFPSKVKLTTSGQSHLQTLGGL